MKQLQNMSPMTDAIERELIERELRAMAQRAAARAFARGVRRVFANLKRVLRGARPATAAGDLRSV